MEFSRSPEVGDTLPSLPPVPPAGGGRDLASADGSSPRRPKPAAPDAMALLKALRRRWKSTLFLGLTLGALAAALAWVLTVPAKYTARAILHVSTTPPKLVFEHDNSTDYRTYQQTQVALIGSRLVLSSALSAPEVLGTPTVMQQPDPIEWLERELTVKFPGGSEILEISLSGDRPEDLPVIVNAVVKSYMYNEVERETRDRKHRYNELKKIYDDQQAVLEEKRARWKGIAKAVGSGDRATQAVRHQLALEHIGKIRGELLQVQAERRRAEVEASSLEATSTLVGEVPDWQVRQRIEQDATLLDLRDRYAQAYRHYAQYARTARKQDDSATLNAYQRCRAIEAELKNREGKLWDLFKTQIAGEEERERLALRTEARDRVNMLAKYEEALESELKSLDAKDVEYNQETLDFQTIQDEIALVDETAKKVGLLVQSIDVEVKAPPRIRLLDGATTPRTKDDRKRFKVTGAAGLGALAFVVLGLSYWEAQARRVDTADEVAKGVGVRLMGVLPFTRLPRRRAWSLPIRAKGRVAMSQLVESVNATRTMLLHASREGVVRVVMVTSARKGEGKTSLSCHLATSLAYAGRPTLLIDCDLRNPSVHKVFEQPLTPGLSELLRGECTADTVVRPTPQARLSIIPAGVADPRALQALAMADFEVTFDALRRGVEFIVVDTAPVLPVADTLLISQHVDAVILSVLSDVSRVPEVREAHDRLAALGVRVLGAVLNGAKVASPYDYH